MQLGNGGIKPYNCITEPRDQYKANGLTVTPVCKYGRFLFFSFCSLEIVRKVGYSCE